MNDRKNSRDRRPSPAAGDAAAGQPERIAKRLARAGVASRREAESLIADGRVRVNGRLLDSPAFNVTATDRIEIDGEPIPEIERTRLFLFHKPAGVVTTNRDPEGRRTVFDVLPAGLPRLITVGRLDINTEGLLLLTNDGGLARVLELPQTGWLRRYRVRVHGEVDEGALAGLKDGIAVDGVFYGAIEAALDRRQGTNAWLTVGLREGKNREVKNVMAALGLEVSRLIRVSYGPFQLAELEEGQVRELKGRMLRDQLGPRLIEEAGANFDAPVVNPFSGADAARPERGDDEKPRRERSERPARAAGPERSPRPAPRPAPRVEEGGLVRNRKRDRSEKRDDALARLSTSSPRSAKPRGDKPFGDKPFADRPRGGKGERREEAPRKPRTANVWMAPGARPQPDRKAGDEKIVKVPRKPGDRKASHDAAARRHRPGRAERAGGEQASERPKREYKPRPLGEDRPRREYKPRPEGEDRPKREWKPRPEGDARPKRDFKPRPQGEDRPRREYEPRAEGSAAEQPKREWKPRPQGEDRPKREYKPRADAPQRDWKARPPRPGKAERAAGEGGRSYEYKARPKGGEGEASREGERKPWERAGPKSAPKPAGSSPRGQGGAPRGGAGGKAAPRGGPRKGPPKGPRKGPPKGGRS